MALVRSRLARYAIGPYGAFIVASATGSIDLFVRRFIRHRTGLPIVHTQGSTPVYEGLPRFHGSLDAVGEFEELSQSPMCYAGR
jgi:hypothetical protein